MKRQFFDARGESDTYPATKPPPGCRLHLQPRHQQQQPKDKVILVLVVKVPTGWMSSIIASSLQQRLDRTPETDGIRMKVKATRTKHEEKSC